MRVVPAEEVTQGTEETFKLGLRKHIGEAMKIDGHRVTEDSLEKDEWGNAQMVVSPLQRRRPSRCIRERSPRLVFHQFLEGLALLRSGLVCGIAKRGEDNRFHIVRELQNLASGGRIKRRHPACP